MSYIYAKTEYLKKYGVLEGLVYSWFENQIYFTLRDANRLEEKGEVFVRWDVEKMKRDFEFANHEQVLEISNEANKKKYLIIRKADEGELFFNFIIPDETILKTKHPWKKTKLIYKLKKALDITESSAFIGAQILKYLFKLNNDGIPEILFDPFDIKDIDFTKDSKEIDIDWCIQELIATGFMEKMDDGLYILNLFDTWDLSEIIPLTGVDT